MLKEISNDAAAAVAVLLQLFFSFLRHFNKGTAREQHRRIFPIDNIVGFYCGPGLARVPLWIGVWLMSNAASNHVNDGWWSDILAQSQRPKFSISPLQKYFCELFTRWMRRINVKDIGAFPSGWVGEEGRGCEQGGKSRVLVPPCQRP